VGVTSGNDVPVTDLGPADFTVREDGLAREILRVEAAPLPTHLVLLVDDSQITQPSITYLRTALTTFVQRISAAVPEGQAGLQTQMAFWTFGERPTQRVDFTTAPALIERAIGKLFHITGSGSYLLDAVIDVSKSLKKKEAARPVIVVFCSEDGAEFSNRTSKDVSDALQDAGASLWAVTLQVGNQRTSSTEARERAILLGDVTRTSGGYNKVILTPQSLESGFTTIANNLTGRYLVTYGRRDTLVPPSKLEVDVKRQGVQVRASRWAGR
jgi:VWFA-related protein